MLLQISKTPSPQKHRRENIHSYVKYMYSVKKKKIHHHQKTFLLSACLYISDNDGPFTHTLNLSVYRLSFPQPSQLFSPCYLLWQCKPALFGCKLHIAFPFHFWPAAQSHAAGAVSGMSPSNKSIVT